MSKFRLKMREYKCPKCGTMLLRIPSSEPIPEEKEERPCPNCGATVKLPMYRRAMAF